VAGSWALEPGMGLQPTPAAALRTLFAGRQFSGHDLCAGFAMGGLFAAETAGRRGLCLAGGLPPRWRALSIQVELHYGSHRAHGAWELRADSRVPEAQFLDAAAQGMPRDRRAPVTRKRNSAHRPMGQRQGLGSRPIRQSRWRTYHPALPGPSHTETQFGMLGMCAATRPIQIRSTRAVLRRLTLSRMVKLVPRGSLASSQSYMISVRARSESLFGRVSWPSRAAQLGVEQMWLSCTNTDELVERKRMNHQ